MPRLEPDTYISERLDAQLQWLSRASRRNKRQFVLWRAFDILLGTCVMIFSPFARTVPWVPLWLAIAGGGIAISGSLLALNRNQENWVRYRTLAENLKREKYLFLTGTAPYDHADAFRQFVATSEAMMLDERLVWGRRIVDVAPKAATAAVTEGRGGTTAADSP